MLRPLRLLPAFVAALCIFASGWGAAAHSPQLDPVAAAAPGAPSHDSVNGTWNSTFPGHNSTNSTHGHHGHGGHGGNSTGGGGGHGGNSTGGNGTNGSAPPTLPVLPIDVAAPDVLRGLSVPDALKAVPLP